ncbi:Solute carrier family 25 member 36 [Heterocephalus glaber]|uniref:Solute carrier family 25 member 36 n=1 Tax=Heterocephalus glaber TaxID=10181 RepID=G5BAB2_HETGA|nr:Solute carrier family 25 member 36 [Heterocephalus glaber]
MQEASACEDSQLKNNYSTALEHRPLRCKEGEAYSSGLMHALLGQSEFPIPKQRDLSHQEQQVEEQTPGWKSERSSLYLLLIRTKWDSFTAITATNPIWLIKTRLQLDARNHREKQMRAFECIHKVYQIDERKGFYRGMSASYAGISETVIHFVIYESIKQELQECKTASVIENGEESVKEASDFVGMMLAAATSKTCATTITCPHKVVRTRLCEERTKYRSFFQKLSLLIQEEGYGSLYLGLTTHLVRRIPDTAIMMATYELAVYLLNG